MSSRIGAVALTGWSVVLGVAMCAGTTWAQDLPSDPRVVTGVLDNGMTYKVLSHPKPEGHIGLYLHVSSGSLNETDKQRGIAHYLEHMAFNGSENFAPGTVVPFFQSLGMTFGRDQNAYTNMQETVYQLSLPDTKPETLSKGMTFFADIAGRLTLPPKEIEAERQIIQEERRSRLSGRQRTAFSVFERMTPGSIYGQRMTIGLEETINGVNQQDFKDYYSKYYAASNATVMVVADTDPASVVAIIKDRFSALPNTPKPTPQPLGVKPYDKSFAIIATDPEVRTGSVRISSLSPARQPTTTVEQYRDDLVIILGRGAFNRRIRDRVSAGGTSYESASVSSGNESKAIHQVELSASVAPEEWKAGLAEAALELQRARAFGFSSREIDDAKKQIISGAERAVETEGTMEARGLIGRINSAVGEGEPIVSPTQRLELVNKLLPTITKEEIDARFAKEFDFKAVAFIAVLPTGANVPTEAELVDLGIKALAAKPTAVAETARATTLMAEKPAPGVVKEMTEHAASRVWSGWLGNNVRLHYRFMDERKNEASVRISLLGGELLETAENRGITSAAQLAWSNQATKSLTSADIRELMTGKKVNVGGGGFGGGGGRRGGGGGGGGSADSISLSISGNPEEFETGFQLAYLLLTEPRIEAPAFERLQTMTPRFLEEMMKSAEGIAARTIAAAPFPDGEPRTNMVTPEQIAALKLPAAQAWLEKLIKESPIEVTIVGDIAKDRALDLAARYLGALPVRDRVSPDAYRSLRTLKRPAGPRIFEKTVATETKKAQVFSGFYGADESNLADARALSLAARLLSTRMTREVREESQLVYSMGASSRAATTYPGFGIFSATSTTAPEKAAALAAKIPLMYEAFAKDGPTDEELEVAKKQRAKDFEDQFRTPQFWSGQLSEMTFRGANLDDVIGSPAAYEAITAQQVRETFAKYYSKQNSIVVVVTPEGTGAEKKAPASN